MLPPRKLNLKFFLMFMYLVALIMAHLIDPPKQPHTTFFELLEFSPDGKHLLLKEDRRRDRFRSSFSVVDIKSDEIKQMNSQLSDLDDDIQKGIYLCRQAMFIDNETVVLKLFDPYDLTYHHLNNPRLSCRWNFAQEIFDELSADEYQKFEKSKSIKPSACEKFRWSHERSLETCAVYDELSHDPKSLFQQIPDQTEPFFVFRNSLGYVRSIDFEHDRWVQRGNFQQIIAEKQNAEFLAYSTKDFQYFLFQRGDVLELTDINWRVLKQISAPTIHGDSHFCISPDGKFLAVLNLRSVRQKYYSFLQVIDLGSGQVIFQRRIPKYKSELTFVNFGFLIWISLAACITYRQMERAGFFTPTKPTEFNIF